MWLPRNQFSRTCEHATLVAVIAADAGKCPPASRAHARNDNLAECDLRSSGLGVPFKKMLARNTFHADFSRGSGTARPGAVCTRALILNARVNRNCIEAVCPE